MAQSSAIPVRAAPVTVGQLPRVWEDWLTYLMALGMVTGVTLSIENAGITDQMPALWLIGGLALLAGMLFACSRLRLYVAWPIGIVLGAAVCFWQTLEKVPGATPGDRINVIYDRFYAWFYIVFHGGVSNDPLPFVVLLVALTWLSVFLVAWSLFRWNHAWFAVVAGGTVIFINLAATGTGISAAAFLYALGSLLLLMRVNLRWQIRGWHKDEVSYPPLLSLSYLHLTGWVVGIVLIFSWLLPAGGRPAIGFWGNLIEDSSGFFVGFVRLAGPLHASKVTPIHDYTSVFPFSGSVKLTERELLNVKLEDPNYKGPILLRGTTYDRYSAGGWEVGDRVDVPISASLSSKLNQRLQNSAVDGELLPLTIRVDAKSVVGTVIFTPGQPVGATIPGQLRVARDSLITLPVASRFRASDDEILSQLPADLAGLTVERDASGRPQNILALSKSDPALPDATSARPQQPLLKGQSYQVLGFIPNVSSTDLRNAGAAYPDWVQTRYTQLPASLPQRVRDLAQEITATASDPYDATKQIESYLRGYTINLKPGQTPPGRDTVDYFLFDLKEGYFNYNASAMVVMLRSLGIPARMAVGFVLDNQTTINPDGSFTIRDRNAYAWAEVYFPQYGWIDFNPAPDRLPFELLGDIGATTQNGGLDSLFNNRNLGGLEDLFPNEDVPIDAAPIALPSQSGPALPPQLILAIVAGVALLGVVIGGSLWWQASVAGLPYSQQVWEKTMRLAGLAGYRARPGQTPSEFATQLGKAIDYPEDTRLLARLYNRSRFGRREPGSEEADRLSFAWRNIRRALLWEVARLKEPKPASGQDYFPWR
ncbi:MAG TPA: transglutaminase domain-containing protein [Dehalococcoidia bacterium]|nr:transglutaminase domain-containing protein [Dehalococcoidia bacterium]